MPFRLPTEALWERCTFWTISTTAKVKLTNGLSQRRTARIKVTEPWRIRLDRGNQAVRGGKPVLKRLQDSNTGTSLEARAGRERQTTLPKSSACLITALFTRSLSELWLWTAKGWLKTTARLTSTSSCDITLRNNLQKIYSDRNDELLTRFGLITNDLAKTTKKRSKHTSKAGISTIQTPSRSRRTRYEK